MVNGEASCQSFIHESASKVGGKPTFEMTQYHRNLIFTIIVKKGHDYGIIGDTFRRLLNIIKVVQKSIVGLKQTNATETQSQEQQRILQLHLQEWIFFPPRLNKF